MNAAAAAERSSRAVTLAKVAVTVGVVAVAQRHVDFAAVARRLVTLDARYVAAFVALSLVFYVLCAARWRFTAARLGAALPFRRALSLYYLSTLLNQILPLGIAGDLVRAARHRERDALASIDLPIRAVVLERLSGLLGLAVLAFAATVLAAKRGLTPWRTEWLAPATAIAVLASALFFAWSRRSARGAALVRGVHEALVARGALAVQLALSIGASLTLLLMFACAARAAGVALDAATTFTIVPFVFAATTLPWAFAGWGAREVTAGALFAAVGLGADAGVAASIAFGVLSLVAALPGVLVLSTRRAEARA